MLIGAGYDAYCVQGYATLETCTLDETQQLCPLLRKPPEVRPAGRSPACMLSLFISSELQK